MYSVLFFLLDTQGERTELKATFRLLDLQTADTGGARGSFLTNWPREIPQSPRIVVKEFKVVCKVGLVPLVWFVLLPTRAEKRL